MSYGIVIEFIQHFFIPHRSFDLRDIAADAVGCVVGFLFLKKLFSHGVNAKVLMVCFYGPESTGKSVLIERVANLYGTVFVPEVAREMITSNDFSVEDIVRIGEAHYERIQQKLKAANKILFCDTDAITTQLYSQKYLSVVPPALFELERKVKYDLYFLFDVDVPWVADGMRDLGGEREKMFEWFRGALEKRNVPYCLVQGDYATREKIVRKTIDEVLAKRNR